MLERLVMAEVTGTSPVVDRDDKSGELTPDPAGRLDVLGGRLGLSAANHHPQPGDIDPDRDHVGGEQNIERSWLQVGRVLVGPTRLLTLLLHYRVEWILQPIQGLRDSRRAQP